MKTKTKAFLFFLLFAGPISGALAQGTFKIGELNSYKVFPAFLEPYKKGMELAVEEINAAGGVNGKKLELIVRDDGGNPGDAARSAEELISREKADVLMGTFASNVGLAVSNLAHQRKILFVASEPLTDKIVWENGNRHTFRLRPSTHMQTAMLIADAAKLKKKRWALVYPNYEYGQSAANSFKKLLKAAQPDVEFVAELAPPLGKIDGGVVVQALMDAKPDAIFSALFAADLQKFAREGNTRGLFKNTPVVNLLAGEPEYLEPLKEETPEGWIVTGYPWSEIKTPEHAKFLASYQKRWNEHPRLGSVVGYSTVIAIVEAARKAKSSETDKLISALEGLNTPSPFGNVHWRAIDHQSTMGAYVGRLTQKNGQGMMVDWRFVDGAKALPSDEEVRAMRKAN